MESFNCLYIMKMQEQDFSLFSTATFMEILKSWLSESKSIFVSHP